MNPSPAPSQIHAITPECQPVFPCWLWHNGNHLMPAQWQHSDNLILSLAVSPYTSHWHPDQPVAPTERPDDNPYNGAPIGPGELEREAEERTPAPVPSVKGAREAIQLAVVFGGECDDMQAAKAKAFIDRVTAAVAPYLAPPVSADSTKEEGLPQTWQEGEQLLGELLAAGTTGLDGSPGDPLCKRAHDAIVYLSTKSAPPAAPTLREAGEVPQWAMQAACRIENFCKLWIQRAPGLGDFDKQVAAIIARHAPPPSESAKGMSEGKR